MIDLRSDTVTRPTPDMRRAIAEAIVGDDVFGEDPTVRRLQEMTAELLGKEAALFVPTGTMANQIAVGLHAGPGDELICESTSHVYVWEGGGVARLSGVTTRTAIAPGGLLRLEDLQGKIRPDDSHYVRTRLICLENTHNRGGGRIHPHESIREISAWARNNGIAMHLDGARLMNAVSASGVSASKWCEHFDTVSICYSKALGAPVGSAIAGSAELIKKAHRARKVLGGGMRQVGLLAAAAIHALEHNVARLAEDHANAQVLADAVRDNPRLRIESGVVETNLVWVEVDPSLGTAKEVAAQLKDRGVLVAALGPNVLRACTHLDVDRAGVERAAEAIRGLKPL